MKRVLRPPRYLPEVLQAIYTLKEIGGSNTQKIVDYINRREDRKETYPQTARPRNITSQVQRALKHAVQMGLLKQRAGKFRIDSSKIDKVTNPFKRPVIANKKRISTKKKRRGGAHDSVASTEHHTRSSRNDYYKYHKNRDHGSTDISEDDNKDHSDDDLSDDSKGRKAGRRGSKRGRKRSRRSRKHARKHGHRGEYSPDVNLKKKNNEDDDNDHHNDDHHDHDHHHHHHRQVYPDDHAVDHSDIDDLRHHPQCDNPDCLCKVKEEDMEDFLHHDQEHDPLMEVDGEYDLHKDNCDIQ